jgi:ribonuclease HII
MNMLTLGIDDAGRGPVIGPMILAGVLVNSKQEKKLKESKISDSKLILHPMRIRLAELIKKNSEAHHVVVVQPSDIDFALKTGTNLNTLEAIHVAEIVNKLNIPGKKIKVIVDCPSVNTVAWRSTLLSYVKNSENLEIHCEHKADANHISVGAGSILAKVVREEEVSKLKKKYGEVGSGYPSDPMTKEFLKSRGKELADEGIFRKTWSTWKKIYPEKNQSSLDGF